MQINTIMFNFILRIIIKKETMLSFRYFILLALFLSINLCNFGVVEEGDITSNNQFTENYDYSMSQNLLDQDENDEILIQEVKQKTEYYRKKRRSSKDLKKIKINEFVSTELKKYRNKDRKNIGTKIRPNEWSKELFNVAGTLVFLALCIYKYYQEENV